MARSESTVLQALRGESRADRQQLYAAFLFACADDTPAKLMGELLPDPRPQRLLILPPAHTK